MSSLEYYNVASVQEALMSFNIWRDITINFTHSNSNDVKYTSNSLNTYFYNIFGTRPPSQDELSQIIIMSYNWRISVEKINNKNGILAVNAFEEMISSYINMHKSFTTEGMNVDDEALKFSLAIINAAELYTRFFIS